MKLYAISTAIIIAVLIGAIMLSGAGFFASIGYLALATLLFVGIATLLASTTYMGAKYM